MAIPPLCLRRNRRQESSDSDDSEDMESAPVYRAPVRKKPRLPGMNAADVAALIPIFGEKGENFIRAEDWVKRLESLKRTHGWSQRLTMIYAAMRLRGAASFWYETAQEGLSTWSMFKQELVENFPDTVNSKDVHEMLKNRKKGSTEDIEMYFHKTVAIGKRARLEDSVIQEYLIDGLETEAQKSAIRARGAASLKELLQDMVRVCTVGGKEPKEKENVEVPVVEKVIPNERRAYKDRDDRHNYRGGFRRRNWRPRRYAGGTHEPNWRERKERSSDVKVEKSSGSKDEKRDRDKKYDRRKKYVKRCFKCHSESHLAYQCKQDFHVTVVDQLATRKNNELYKTVEIDGQKFEGYVDLGSECTLMSESVAKKLSGVKNEMKIRIHGFNGQQTETIGSIKKKLIIDDYEKEVDVHIVKEDLKPGGFIVGLDYFDDEQVIVMKKWKGLEITKKQVPVRNVMPVCANSKEFKKPITKENVHIGKGLSDEQLVKLLGMLNDYRIVFANNLRELGKTKLEKMKIILEKKDVVSYKPYRVAVGHREELRKLVNEMLDNMIIQKSNSEYASPIILVKKKNGGLRPCVDFRKLNELIKKESFPTPNIEEELNSFAGKKYFTKLDLLSGYYQIEVDEQSRKYLAFVTPDGKYEFLRVPFGCKNSPAIFMRLIARVLEPLGKENISFFMDDIIIHTKDLETMMETLRRVLEELRKANLTLNWEKCEFLVEHTTYLGHIISYEGVTPANKNTMAIKEFPRPRRQKQIKRFLGMTGYFRRYVKDYAGIVAPLRQVLKGNTFFWKEAQEKAFQQLKVSLTTQPVLACFDPKAAHELHCDGSKRGLGAILLQVEDGKAPKPVAFFSRQLTDIEAGYTPHEHETMALVESLKRFYYYLLDRHFTVYTDCQSVQKTKGMLKINPRIARWWMQIQEFDFDIKYRRSAQMQHADCLSRPTDREDDHEENCEGEMAVFAVKKEESDWIAAMQLKDEDLMRVKQILLGEISDKLEKKVKKEFSLQKGVIYRWTDAGWKFVVPSGVRHYVVQFSHDGMGHPALERTIEIVQRDFWFPKLRAFCEKFIKNCIKCGVYKRSKDENRYKLNCVEVKSVPFYTCHMDFAGPFPKSSKGNEHIFAMVDAFTGFTVLRAVKSASASNAIKVIEDVAQYFGMPTNSVSDRGAAFTSKPFKTFCENYGIKLALVAAKAARGNGKIERRFRVVKESLKTMSERTDGSDWENNLRAVQWALNSTKNRVTGRSPQEMLLSYRPKDIHGNVLLNFLKTEEMLDAEVDLEEIRAKAHDRMTQQRLKQRDTINKKKIAPTEYQEGDLVLLRYDPPASGGSRKMVPRYRGPYVVKTKLGADRYLIEDTPATRVTNKVFSSVYAAENMKKFMDPSDAIWEHDLY